MTSIGQFEEVIALHADFLIAHKLAEPSLDRFPKNLQPHEQCRWAIGLLQALGCGHCSSYVYVNKIRMTKTVEHSHRVCLADG